MTKKYEEIIDTEKYMPDRNGMSPEDKVIKFQYAIYKIFNVKQSSTDKPETNQDIVTNMTKIPFRYIDQLSTPKPEIRRLASSNQETREIRLLTSGSQDTITAIENNQNLPAKKDEKIGTSNLQDIFHKKGIKKLDFTKKE